MNKPLVVIACALLFSSFLLADRQKVLLAGTAFVLGNALLWVAGRENERRETIRRNRQLRK